MPPPPDSRIHRKEPPIGFSVASAGDVDGDGYSDVIVGAHYFDNGETDDGRPNVYHGSPTGLNATPSWTAESNHAGPFGCSVASAGDDYRDVIRMYCGGRIMTMARLMKAVCLLSRFILRLERLLYGYKNLTCYAYFGTSVASAGDVMGMAFCCNCRFLIMTRSGGRRFMPLINAQPVVNICSISQKVLSC
jgi:hypothetical protein